MAERATAAVTEQVVAYSQTSAEMAGNIQAAVELALGAFVRGAASADVDLDVPTAPGLEGAYALGRGEARSGRSMDALLSAYRAGARASWQVMADVLVGHDVASATVAHFAELVFVYIDELSASSAAGHTDELEVSGRAQREHLEKLAASLIDGSSQAEVDRRADRAGWEPPSSLTAVVLPSAHVRAALAVVDARTLVLSGGAAGLPDGDSLAILLVPDVHRHRSRLLASLADRFAVVGPAADWSNASDSFRRARAASAIRRSPRREPVDVEGHLVEIVLAADRDARDDLRQRVLEPLADLRPATAERLAETLFTWLVHQGRRGAVAEHLNIHPQTVRYRMDQVRERYGDRLADPRFAYEVIVALAPDEIL